MNISSTDKKHQDMAGHNVAAQKQLKNVHRISDLFHKQFSAVSMEEEEEEEEEEAEIEQDSKGNKYNNTDKVFCACRMKDPHYDEDHDDEEDKI